MLVLNKDQWMQIAHMLQGSHRCCFWFFVIQLFQTQGEGGNPFCCDGYPQERGRVLGGSSTINVKFYSQTDHNYFKELGMNWDQRSEFDCNEIITYEEVALTKKEELKKVSWGPNHQAKAPKCTSVVLRNDSKSLGTCMAFATRKV